jgi:hypothetical protein
MSVFFTNSSRNSYTFIYLQRTPLFLEIHNVYYTSLSSLAGLVIYTIAFIFHNNKHYFAFKHLVNQRRAAPRRAGTNKL